MFWTCSPIARIVPRSSPTMRTSTGASMTSPCCSSLTNTLASGATNGSFAKLLHKLWRSLDGMRIDQKLRVVGCCRDWVDAVIEARKAGAQEAGIAANFFLFAQDAFNAADRRVGGFDARSFRQPDVHHKLVALRQREELLANKRQNPYTGDKSKYTGN